MADVKISELTALTSPDGAEELVVNDGGTTKKITITNATSASLAKSGGTMTGVIAGFESTGIDDNATSTAITIDASENVGVGQTSPITKLDASQDNIGGNVALGIFQSGNAYGNVASSASLYLGATYHSLANSAKITSTHSSGTTGNHAQDLTFNPINSGSTSFEAMRIDSGGRAIIGGGVTLGNGQTYAAANTLDDYEEGTWTPVIQNTTGTFIASEAFNYVKVGKLVTTRGYIYNGNVASASAVWQFGGLPFQPLRESYGVVQFYLVNIPSDSAWVNVYANPTSSYIRLIATRDASTNDSLQWSDVGTGHVDFHLTYLTT